MQYTNMHTNEHKRKMDGRYLFVAEEEEIQQTPEEDQVPKAQPGNVSPHQEHQEHQEQESQPDDDPIIRSIPLVHGSLPDRQSQSLHVLQFTGRPKKQSFAQHSLTAMVKPNSKVVQLRTPMNTQKFYNEGRATELGGRVENVALQGVLTETNGGLYAGKIIDDDEGQKIVLVPLDSTAQLRPLFKYIDDLDNARFQQARQENLGADAAKLNAVQVLQTASKPVNGLNGESQFTGGIGSCLRHVKRFNEEEWLSLSWFGSDDSPTGELIHALSNPKAENVEASTVLDEFL